MQLRLLLVFVSVLLLVTSAKGHERSTIRCDVVIVGGGLSGLYIADALESANYQTCVFEKDDRWGGRYYDVFYEGLREPIGVGGWRIDESHIRMQRLIKRLGISTIPWSKTLKKWDSRGVIKDSEDALKQAVFPSVGNQDSYAWLYNLSEQVRQYPNTYAYLLSYYGQEGLNLALDTNYGFKSDLWDTDPYNMIELGRDEGSDSGNVSRPVRGMTAITNTLLLRATLKGSKLYKNQPVRSVFKRSNKYIINTDNFRATADSIVFSATPLALQRIEGDLIERIISQEQFKSLYPVYVFKGGAVYASAWWEPHLKALELYQTSSTCLGSLLPAPSRGRKGEALIHHVYSDGPCVNSFWKDMSRNSRVAIDKVVKNKLQFLFPNVSIPDPLLSAYHFWEDGAWHYQKPGYNFTLAQIQSWAVSPLGVSENVYLVGEAYGIRRAWGEGALATADNALKRGWNISSVN